MAGVPSSLLGYPVVEAEDMPAIGANSLSPYVRLYTYKRVGGDMNDFHGIKLLKFI